MPHSPGARLEDAVNQRVVPRLRRRGWSPILIPFTGYGSEKSIRVLARAVMHDPDADADLTRAGRLLDSQRGYRAFLSTHVAMMPVEITAGRVTIKTKTDRNGYIDVVVHGHGLEPGPHAVTLRALSGDETTAPVTVISSQARYGVISDIDDTVMVTYLPRALIAAWNTFVKHTRARQPVSGMADLLTALRTEHPEMPVIYLSTGAWNVVPTLTRFLETHNYPDGPMLMTDWGPTNFGWFRSGLEHKRTQMRRLAIEFPNIQWFLLGDDGQHDPLLYREMARDHPEHVRAVMIRTLNPTEQFLAHGTVTEIYHPQMPVHDELDRPVPLIEGPDGHVLREKLAEAGHHTIGQNK